MGTLAARRAVAEYQSTSVDARVTEATPYRLVSMLFEGVSSRIYRAKGAMERKEVALKGEMISQ
jgi:flagellar protein FliS